MSESAPTEHDHHDRQPAGLDPDEPQTPYWLTALGGALFLALAVFFMATAGDDADALAPAGGGAEEAAPEPPSEE